MSTTFSKFAGALGILAGLAGLAYLILFVILKNPAALLPALALMLLGVYASATLVGLYYWVRPVDEGFALWGLLLGILGSAGAAIHGAFDVANNFNPPAAPFAYAFPVDPRGFLTFAVAGLAAIVLSWLILRGQVLSPAVGYLGILSGLLLLALFIAYMVILNATNPIVVILVFASGLAQPIWYLWIGWLLWQGKGTMSARAR